MIRINGQVASQYLMVHRTGYSPTRYSAKYDGPEYCQGLTDPWVQKAHQNEVRAFLAFKGSKWGQAIIKEQLGIDEDA